MRDSDWTQVYGDADADGPFFYVRLVPLETERFRHGIGLSSRFTDKKAAEAFADLVDEYMDEAVIDHNKRTYDPPRDY
ncbi:hypothetical protein HOU03_gp060 [Caulobacter phage CcrSC]|uniref:Uncharacterized protein n=1 Tax=Caulobacter phage CcrSC TaxID=2283272 RepID=A0A385EFM3_9CAUD|nr:hypothetical protein HOU03_gp060 [Caulobacter phage CcrSC]AXQ69642.1 hypothetical protein CcrSC_gp060c [Caulobacter phage CcrSC]